MFREFKPSAILHPLRFLSALFCALHTEYLALKILVEDSHGKTKEVEATANQIIKKMEKLIKLNVLNKGWQKKMRGSGRKIPIPLINPSVKPIDAFLFFC